MRYLILASVLVCGPAVAQEADTLDPAGYFPLAVGNEWEYAFDLHRPASPTRPDSESRTEYVRLRIIGEGLGPNGDLFALVSERFSNTGAHLSRDTANVAYDPETATIRPFDGLRSYPYNPSDFAFDLDYPLDEYAPDFSNFWHYATRLSEAAAEYILPPFLSEVEPDATKKFESLMIEVHAVHGLGSVGGSFYPEGCSSFCDEDVWVLTYAEVGGKTYGARAVRVEELPAASEAAMLDVYPNPSRLQVRVGGAGMSVDVFDVLGRRVRSYVASPHEPVQINAAEFTPGVYVVRRGMASAIVTFQ